MKKIFTLIAAVMATASIYAQVEFRDPEGKAYNDGETMTIMVDYDAKYDEYKFESPVLYNNGAAAVNVYFSLTFEQLPENTAISDCYYNKCRPTFESHETEVKPIPSGKSVPTMIEWTPSNITTWDWVFGTAIVKYAMYVNGDLDKTVTVHFVNPDPAGIEGIVSDINNKKVVAYNLKGQRVNTNTKGIVLINGKKFINK